MMQDSLARNLRVLRAERGINLGEAEELTGVTRETLAALEHGQRGAYTNTLRKIAEAYGVTLGDLLGERVALGKAEAPGTGPTPYEVGEVVASIPYAEGGQAEAFEEAVLAAREARPHVPDHAQLAIIDNGERVEVIIEVPTDADLSVGTRRIRRRMRRRV